MRSNRLILLILILVGSSIRVSAGEPAEVPSLVLDQWLALGPVPIVPPAFAGDDGENKAAEALESATLPNLHRLPRDGESLDGFAWWGAEERSALQWPAPDEVGEGGTAVVWLATSLATPRFFTGALTVESNHLWKLVVDGKEIEGGELKLAPGSHVVFLASVFDVAAGGDWTLEAAVEGDGADALAVDTSPTRDLGILDLLDAATVRSFDLSPEGDRVVLAVSAIRPGTKIRDSRVELRSTADGALRQSWRGSPAMSSVRFAPTGNRISYTTNSDGKTSLWLADLGTGAIDEVLSGLEDWGGYRWSPTGDQIVYSITSEYQADERGIKRLRGLLDRMADHRDLTRLYLVDVASGVRRQLTSGPLSVSVAAFSPDGSRLMVTREVEDLAQRPYTVNELWEIDLASGAHRKLRDFRWLTGGLQYAPDGRRILVQAGPSEFGNAGIAGTPSGPVNDFDGQLYIWDPKSGEVEALTRDFDPSVTAAVWSRHDGRIYALAVNGHESTLFVKNPDGGGFHEVETGLESADDFAVADSGTMILVTGTSVWQPQKLVALDEAEGSARVVLEPAEMRFADVRRGAVESWDFTASDGRLVAGRIYLPTSFDPGKRYPAIVNYYGGTSPMTRSFGGRYPAEWWAASGYVVYVLTPTGAYGWGQEISTVHVNDWGQVTSRQIVEAAKAFVESHGYVDPDRVGCIGASYGGFMTMKILTETDFFATAVAHAGISALSSYWGEGYWGYSYGAVANADSFPWNRRDIFVERSPLFSADRVTTPVLLTHGDEDPNVPPGESDQFYAALKLLGAEVEYLRVAGLGHLIMEHDKRALWSESIVAWFDRWLKGQPEWWDALYPEG